jgi:hypothetical protein
MRVLCLSGEVLRVAGGSAVSTQGAKVQACASTAWAASCVSGNDEHGPLAAARRCISLPVFIASLRSGRLLSIAVPGAIDPANKDHEKDVEAEAWPRSFVERER